MDSVSGKGATAVSFQVRPTVDMDLGLLSKEARPSEYRAWWTKFQAWISCSMQGVPPEGVPQSFLVRTFLSKLDSWWHNRLFPRVREETILEEILSMVEVELRVLFPVSRIRDLLFESIQKGGRVQAISSWN